MGHAVTERDRDAFLGSVCCTYRLVQISIFSAQMDAEDFVFFLLLEVALAVAVYLVGSCYTN
jgi:hypothetical protein